MNRAEALEALLKGRAITNKEWRMASDGEGIYIKTDMESVALYSACGLVCDDDLSAQDFIDLCRHKDGYGIVEEGFDAIEALKRRIAGKKIRRKEVTE